MDPRTILPRLSAAAARDPSAPALVTEGRLALRYGELHAAAFTLGRALRARGVGRERVVAIALPRSPEWVVSMLATWLAGGAFLPLDPSLPAQRRARILEEAGVRHAIVSARLGMPEALVDARVAAVDVACAFERADGADEDDAPLRGPRADDLAYVLYTSGSTGAPKGVMVTHRGIGALADAQIDAFRLTPRSRVLWVVSPSFDASVSDLVTALGAGAAIHVERSTLLFDPEGFLDVARERGITHVDVPPAFLAKLDAGRAPACLETIVVGGEPTPKETIAAWAPRVRLVGAYGPTEATVCTSLVVRDARDTRALLGDPIPGVRYELVRPSGELARVNEPGELVIGGPAVARGYANDEALTAARFFERDGTRFFRTRDRVVRHADGALELLGRLDRQLKIRGALVAPEEIEAVLAAHPAVRRAHVEKRALGGRDQLVAWVERSSELEADTLARFLAERLPPFLVPRRFAVVDALPETDSHKIDVEALLAAPLPRPTPRGGPPRTERERALFALVCALLDLPEVGRDDDFFALGGDSLAVVELVGRATLDGLPLTPSLVYRVPVLSALAAALDETARGSDEAAPADALRARARAAIDGDLHARLATARARATPLGRAGSPRTVFLTGATGFLGGRLLEELAERTSARFVCLVRAEDERGAGERLAARGLHVAPERITLLAGDLGAPFFGVPLPALARIAAEVDTVVHAAGAVSVAHDYETLRRANVDGTREVLRFAALSPELGRLHFASTLSVFVSTDRARGTHREGDELDATGVVLGGYAQSKWVAEVLVRSAARDAFPVSIYRYGLLTGDSVTGEGAASDWLALFVRGLARVGAVPRDLDPELAMDVTPIDHAARATAALLLHGAGAAGVETFHLAGARPVHPEEIVEAVRRTGVSVEPVDRGAFIARVRERLAAGGRTAEAAACLALSRALDDDGRFGGAHAMDLFQATRATFDASRAHARLAPRGVHAPPVTAALLDRYVRRILDGRNR